MFFYIRGYFEISVFEILGMYVTMQEKEKKTWTFTAKMWLNWRFMVWTTLYTYIIMSYALPGFSLVSYHALYCFLCNLLLDIKIMEEYMMLCCFFMYLDLPCYLTSKRIGNDQECTKSNSTSQPKNQKGKKYTHKRLRKTHRVRVNCNLHPCWKTGIGILWIAKKYI